MVPNFDKFTQIVFDFTSNLLIFLYLNQCNRPCPSVVKLRFLGSRACLKKERGGVEDQPQRVASSSTRREFDAGCGWSRTTQPRSGLFSQALTATS